MIPRDKASQEGTRCRSIKSRSMEITAGGGSFKLEGKAGDMKDLADVFERAKAAAVA
jgi:hypothetical protein